MDKIRLGPRLSALARYAKGAVCLVDVGCDHGYLPVSLLENGFIHTAIATDTHERPLQKAIDCAEQHGLVGKMQFVCTDGLRGIQLDGVDAVAIAGMGGETIQSILAAAPNLRTPGKRLILQPMSKSGELVAWLYAAGFSVRDECLARENGTLYRILLAEFGPAPLPEPAQLLAGEALFRNQDPLLPDYLDVLCRRLRLARDGMLHSPSQAVRDKAAETDVLLLGLEAERKRIKNG